MKKELIPSEIILNIFNYLPIQYFKNTVFISKDTYKHLQNEINLRRQRHLIKTLLYNQKCFSNLDLGKDHGGIYRCQSTRDQKTGSVFCKFCNHIYHKNINKLVSN